ncbi:MAG: hypothetical protein ABSG53_28245 [Thermoguttaceae bacterium]
MIGWYRRTDDSGQITTSGLSLQTKTFFRPSGSWPIANRRRSVGAMNEQDLQAQAQCRILLRMAFAVGYEAGAEDAGSGELLVEAQALQSAFYDMDGKTRRAVAMDDLVMAAILATAEHEEDCGCCICRTLSALDATGRGPNGSLWREPRDPLIRYRFRFGVVVEVANQDFYLLTLGI